jgi:DNA replication and repair protein RecF
LLFSSVRTFNFRNLAPGNIPLEGRDVFLVGENGQGKSNFLEALYFCCYASSFRGATDKELVTAGEHEAAVNATLSAGQGAMSLALKMRGEHKSISIDGKNVQERRELLSLLPVIAFCHEDLRFVLGGPEERRWFFDQNLCLCDAEYVDDLRRYRHVLKTRNSLLKTLRDTASPAGAVLDAVNPQLAEYGLRLMEKRASETAYFSALFEPSYRAIAGIAGVEAHYRPSWKEASVENVVAHLEKNAEREVFAGTTLSGPHRDNYHFTRDGVDFVRRASTGQQRLLSLLLRVAQASRCCAVHGRPPALLLDDVMLELDGETRLKFLSYLPAYEQAFYTFLPEEPYHKYRKSDTLIYRIKDGVFMEGG